MAALDDISNLYVGYFNRAPDPAGLNFWVTQYTALGQTPATLSGIANSFSQVPEATNLYGFLSAPLVGSPTSFLASVYLNLFGRAIDAAGSAFWAGQLALPGAQVGRIIINIISGAQGDDALVVANKSLVGKTFAQDLLNNNAPFSSALAQSALSGVTKDAATATAKIASNLIAIQATAGSAGGQTFTLAAATDNIAGTSAGDTVIGDFASSIQASDQINGAGGNDTFKLFGAFDATKMPLSLTSIETVEFVNPGAFDLSTAGFAGVTKLQIDAIDATANRTFTTGAGTSLQLAGTSGAFTNTWAASATDTTANLILNTYNGTTAAGVITVTGAATTTLNVTSQTGANSLTTLNGPATATTLNLVANTALTLNSVVSAAVSTVNVSGAGNVTLTGTDLAAVLAVNAATATGKVTFTAAEASTLTFTGGAGNDTVLFTATNLTTADKLSGGAGADTIGINDTTPVYAAINAATDFEVLGLFTTGATVDKALLTGINSFFVNTGTQTFQNSINTTTYTLNNAAGLTSVSIGAATGQTATAITIDHGAATTAQTLGTLALTGITTVGLVSTGTGVGGSNTITTFTNVENSNITLTGAKDLTISSALVGTTTGSVFDANAFTGKLTITGSGFNDILTGGSAADTIVGGAGIDTINGGAGNDLLTGGTGADAINVGAGTDTVLLTVAGQTASFATAAALTTATTTGTATALTGVDVVTGMAAADILSVAGVIATIAGTLGTTVNAAVGTVASLVAGTYTAGTNIFVAGTGSDKLFVYDVDGAGAGTAVEAVVLVGMTAAGGTAAAGVVTFA